jgi:hypothetical protein
MLTKEQIDDWNDPPVRLTANDIHTLNQLTEKLHHANVKAGWWPEGGADDPYVVATKIAMVVSEVAEMLEAYRKDLNDDHLPHHKGIAVEGADVLLRLFDLMGALGVKNFGGIVSEKLNYNQSRPDHKKSARAQKNGKKF